MIASWQEVKHLKGALQKNCEGFVGGLSSFAASKDVLLKCMVSLFTLVMTEMPATLEEKSQEYRKGTVEVVDDALCSVDIRLYNVAHTGLAVHQGSELA